MVFGADSAIGVTDFNSLGGAITSPKCKDV